MKTRSKLLAREEWDFSRVPDIEVHDCFLYEFAREAELALYNHACELIRLIKSREEGSGIRPPPRSHEEAAALRGEISKIIQAPDHEPAPAPISQSERALKDLWMHNPGPPRFQYAGLDRYQPPSPWQNMDARAKDRASRTIAKLSLNDLPPLEILKWERQFDPDFCTDYAADGVCTLKRCYVTPAGSASLLLSGRAAVALALDLKHRTDSELTVAFAEMLAVLRQVAAEHGNSPAMHGPGKSGTKPSAWRANLFNLGVMRLRNSHPWKTVIAALGGDNAKQPNGKRLWTEDADEVQDFESRVKELDRRRNHAVKIFRELFPQLGPKAAPERFNGAL